MKNLKKKVIRAFLTTLLLIIIFPGIILRGDELTSLLYYQYSPWFAFGIVIAISASFTYLIFAHKTKPLPLTIAAIILSICAQHLKTSSWFAFGIVIAFSASFTYFIFAHEAKPLPLAIAAIILSICTQHLKTDLDGTRFLPQFHPDNLPRHYNLRETVSIITGANSGLGFGLAKSIASLDGTVILACRRPDACLAASQKINSDVNLPGKAIPMELNLASFQSIHNFVKQFRSNQSRLDYLINNAGFGHVPPTAKNVTEEGFEIGFGSMHLGHFLLTQELLPVMKRTKKRFLLPSSPRLVVISSGASQFGVNNRTIFHPTIFENDGEGDLRGEITKSRYFFMYRRAKIANVLFAREFHKRHNRIQSCSVTPGTVFTSIFDQLAFEKKWLFTVLHMYSNFFLRDLEQGGRTALKCMLSEEVEAKGEYLDAMGRVLKKEELSVPTRDDWLAKRLWDVSEKLVN